MTCFHATAADKCDVCLRVEELEAEVARLRDELEVIEDNPCRECDNPIRAYNALRKVGA